MESQRSHNLKSVPALKLEPALQVQLLSTDLLGAVRTVPVCTVGACPPTVAEGRSGSARGGRTEAVLSFTGRGSVRRRAPARARGGDPLQAHSRRATAGSGLPAQARRAGTSPRATGDIRTRGQYYSMI